MIALALMCVAAAGPACRGARQPRQVKVGILHSMTGTMAISETSVADATRLAIEEINAAGGVLGARLEPVIADGKSDWSAFAQEAERLITQDDVAVVFGCWTSACRKSVLPIFERHQHLLFYPVQYEGLEQSRNIIYTGAAPNQQILPAVKWCFDNLGKRFFLVGSDYVFPRTANAIIKDQIAALRGEVVGEEYILLGSKDVAPVIARIAEAKPDVILNTINGDSNVVFFEQLRAAGITPTAVPTMSFSIAEDELRSMEVAHMVGDYAAWNYFQSMKTPENEAFVARFKARYGADRVTDSSIVAGYVGVHLWARAARAAGSFEPAAVRRALPNQSYPAPEGVVYIDAENNHAWKAVRIGKIQSDGQFEVVWDSRDPVRPVPYPVYRSRAEWAAFLDALHDGWGGAWANPGP